MAGKLLDVNALAITLVSDHPGHEYVRDAVEPGLAGESRLYVYDYLPLRAHWILTAKWGISHADGADAIASLLEQPVDLVDAGRETIRRAYDLSARRDHDVFDCFYLALADSCGADALVTTDTDFDALCRDEDVTYENPVPEEVLASFHAMNE